MCSYEALESADSLAEAALTAWQLIRCANRRDSSDLFGKLCFVWIEYDILLISENHTLSRADGLRQGEWQEQWRRLSHPLQVGQSFFLAASLSSKGVSLAHLTWRRVHQLLQLIPEVVSSMRRMWDGCFKSYRGSRVDKGDEKLDWMSVAHLITFRVTDLWILLNQRDWSLAIEEVMQSCARIWSLAAGHFGNLIWSFTQVHGRSILRSKAYLKTFDEELATRWRCL